RDQHRHARRSGPRHEAGAGVPEGGRRGGAGHRPAGGVATNGGGLRVKRFVVTLDLKDDPRAIEAYEAHHRAVWPEVLKSLRRIGVRSMDIYRLGRRLVMVMDTRDGFDRRRDL